jgi:hypothetical protein
MAVFWVVAPCRLVCEFTIVSEVCTASIVREMAPIALMMEAVQTLETFVNSYQSTRRYSPEDSRLHRHRHENLKSCLVSDTVPPSSHQCLMTSRKNLNVSVFLLSCFSTYETLTWVHTCSLTVSICRKGRREGGGWIVIDTTFNWGEGQKLNLRRLRSPGSANSSFWWRKV